MKGGIPMSVEKNISTIRRYFDEVYNQRNPDAGDALLSPHIVMHGSPVKSVAAWKHYETAYLSAFPYDLMLTI